MSPERWTELAARCQKPDYRTVGNWYARRVSRPLALRVTWVLLPTGISAHAVTLSAWAVAVLGAVALGWGTPLGLVLGAALLQAWYLLDHVDGQIARYRGAASLDGVHLDYLMHHTVHLIVPLGVGFGIFRETGSATWLLIGQVWALASLVIGVEHDVRCKAMLARLKRLSGELRVVGGGGGRPAAAPPLPRDPRRLVGRLARKSCEMHVTMNALGVLAVVGWFWPEVPALSAYASLMAGTSLVVAVASVVRGLRGSAAEREFASWYRLPPSHELVHENGGWRVVPNAAAASDTLAIREAVGSS